MRYLLIFLILSFAVGCVDDDASGLEPIDRTTSAYRNTFVSLLPFGAPRLYRGPYFDDFVVREGGGYLSCTNETGGLRLHHFNEAGETENASVFEDAGEAVGIASDTQGNIVLAVKNVDRGVLIRFPLDGVSAAWEVPIGEEPIQLHCQNGSCWLMCEDQGAYSLKVFRETTGEIVHEQGAGNPGFGGSVDDSVLFAVGETENVVVARTSAADDRSSIRLTVTDPAGVPLNNAILEGHHNIDLHALKLLPDGTVVVGFRSTAENFPAVGEALTVLAVDMDDAVTVLFEDNTCDQRPRLMLDLLNSDELIVAVQESFGDPTCPDAARGTGLKHLQSIHLPNGSFNWRKTYEDVPAQFDTYGFRSLVRAADGGIVLEGGKSNFSEGIILAKLNPEGSL